MQPAEKLPRKIRAQARRTHKIGNRNLPQAADWSRIEAASERSAPGGSAKGKGVDGDFHHYISLIIILSSSASPTVIVPASTILPETSTLALISTVVALISTSVSEVKLRTPSEL